MEKQTVRALEILAAGPAHCHDLVDELQWNMKTASAILSAMHSDGLILRRRKVIPAGRRKECWEYELPAHTAKAAA